MLPFRYCRGCGCGCCRGGGGRRRLRRRRRRERTHASWNLERGKVVEVHSFDFFGGLFFIRRHTQSIQHATFVIIIVTDFYLPHLFGCPTAFSPARTASIQYNKEGLSVLCVHPKKRDRERQFSYIIMLSPLFPWLPRLYAEAGVSNWLRYPVRATVVVALLLITPIAQTSFARNCIYHRLGTTDSLLPFFLPLFVFSSGVEGNWWLGGERGEGDGGLKQDLACSRVANWHTLYKQKPEI